MLRDILTVAELQCETLRTFLYLPKCYQPDEEDKQTKWETLTHRTNLHETIPARCQNSTTT